MSFSSGVVMRVASLFVSLAGMVVPALSVVSAQAARSPAPDPQPQVSRFEERWEAAPTGDALRALKHLPLAPRGLAWLTLGATARWRGSESRDFQFSPADAMQDTFGEWRVTASGDAWVGSRDGWHARGFAEWRDAQGFGRTLPGGVRPNEADRADWQNAFVEVGRGMHGLRAGRQDVALGRERLVGIADWANSRRAFDGIRLMTGRGRWKMEAFDGRVVSVRIDAPDRADTTQRSRFAQLTHLGAPARDGAWRVAGWSAYLIDVEQEMGAVRRVTAGGRLWWDRRAGPLDWSAEVEGASQSGSVRTRDLRAWFGVAEGALTWTRAQLAPGLLAGLDVGSGTGSDSMRVGTFAPPYATAHGFTGIADVVGRGNLVDRRAGVTLKPVRTVQLSIVGRHFTRLRTTDGVYTKTNALLRAPLGSTARPVADELDATFRWQPSPRLRVDGGAAWVRAGAFLQETGASAPVRWAFVMTSFAF